MDANRVRGVLELYRRELEAIGASPLDFPHDSIPLIPRNILGHCLGMLPKMLEFIDEGRMEKVFRWLGFIQGALWALSIYTLDDLKNHNRSDVPLVNRTTPIGE
ncbi:hypothetical protein HGA91_00125 [candidate division WWE3 bacterium]|nr:hypothetical protein [candidate division WWE3 bacterium]